MFFKRLLQTSVSLQKPLKSKLNRHETMMKAVGEAFRELKAERLRNLTSISADSSLLKTGKIPAVQEVIERLEACRTWDQLRETISLLREMRFLGSPKRTEVSAGLLKGLAKIYEVDENAEALVACLDEMLAFEQMNPLILEDNIINAENAETEALKTVLYTALDISQRKQQ